MTEIIQTKDNECVMRITANRVDITDPCYDRDAWCAAWGKEIANGTYFVGTLTDRETGRISAIYMRHRDSSMATDSVEDIVSGCEYDPAQIGVDAGLCGFFPHKPNYPDDGWMELCADLHRADNAYLAKTGHPTAPIYFNADGIFSESGFGDGCYSLYLHKDNSGITDGLAVIFIYRDSDGNECDPEEDVEDDPEDEPEDDPTDEYDYGRHPSEDDP